MPSSEEEKIDEKVNVRVDEKKSKPSLLTKSLARLPSKTPARIKNIPRYPQFFVSVYLIYKGVFIGFVTKVFVSNLNLFTLIMLLVSSYNFIKLFEELVKVLESLKVSSIIHALTKYFYENFVSGKNWKKGVQFRGYNDTLKDLETMQLTHYYQQVLLQMESKIHQVNSKFWKIQFFSMVLYAVGIWFFTFFFGAKGDKLTDISTYKSYTYLVITGIDTIDTENSLFTVELLGTQYMITGLLVEFIFVAFYL